MTKEPIFSVLHSCGHTELHRCRWATDKDIHPLNKPDYADELKKMKCSECQIKGGNAPNFRGNNITLAEPV